MYRFLAVVACALVGGLAGTAPQLTLRSQYQEWERAYRANDVLGLLAILAPDFEIVTESGQRISRAKYKQFLLSRRGPVPQYTIIPTRTRIHGTRATVTSRETVREGNESHAHLYRDLWRRAGNKWHLYRSVTLKEWKAPG